MLMKPGRRKKVAVMDEAIKNPAILFTHRLDVFDLISSPFNPHRSERPDSRTFEKMKC